MYKQNGYRKPLGQRTRTKSLGNVLAPGSPSTRGINSHRSLSVCNEESPSKGRSAAGSTRPSRKASVSSLGEHLSTLMSMSTQVCATLGEKVSSRRQSLTPNDISDNIITNIKSSMKERELHQMALPDFSSNGVSLCKGTLSGLTNITRWGEASLDERPDKVYLNMTLLVKDLYAIYSWNRKKLNGDFSTKINKVFFNLKIRQDLQGSGSPDVTEYSVKQMEGLSVGLNGLGPLNWVGKKVLMGMIQESVTNIMEQRGKEIIRAELSRVSIVDQLSFSLFNPKLI
ncbi:uncharacterized protein LOC111712245 [Eurytemora carolleeae]|uniref:uncharacterized protein LOC111712245 n=1 Tax=Eurytemora carolleeae TaxID=1294199 RepID=UPI000C760C44|nr:uncharacterized protein LOC111712245 [Eurytemora carolleeae]|eukprot:XP_023342581.1 uncharacterized protein LOC111712245 [Eurytemora affinis]